MDVHLYMSALGWGQNSGKREEQLLMLQQPAEDETLDININDF